MGSAYLAIARLFRIGLLGALVATTAGCGVSANPFKFGNLPAKDIRRTHAKPPLRGFYGNFDPKAHTITVTPLESINPVRRQHVFVAAVCDAQGNGLRNRRVEWHVSGVGHIVEVDESGCFPGRGYLVDDKYAVSYTNYREHTITRGNDDPNDDIPLKPGQTWCVVTSAEEGDTFVTCYAPGIHNWERHKVFAVKHWIDATPCFPPPAVNPTGQPHTFTTKVSRITDRGPVAGYRVRYRILDGPPAVLEPGGGPQVEIVTDSQGNANVVLRQLQPTPGINRVAIDVVRPADRPGGKELLLASAETTKTWVAPNLAIQKLAPQAVVVGGQIPYQITVTNTGTVATSGVEIRDTIPETLELLSAAPAATRQGPNLIWSLGPLQPGQSAAVQFVCTATAPGTVHNCAEARMVEGPSGRSCTTTQIVTGALAVAKAGPNVAIVGAPVTFQITVTNQGNGPAANVVVTDAFDPGFAHESGAGPVQMPIGNLAPGEGRSVTITLVPRTTGRLRNQVTATAAGGLAAAAEHFVDVAQPALSIRKTGPRFAFVGAPVDFEVTVQNTGPIPATNVVLRDQLPPELVLQGVPVGGVVQGNAVVYGLGTLAPGEKRSMRVTAVASQFGTNVCNLSEVTADGGIREQAQACVEIRGVPGFGTELIDRLDPVPVGGETTYTIRITNQGSTPANEVVLSCRLPAGLEFVDAEGAVRHQYDPASRIVVFEPFNGMAPKRQLLYQVQAKATRPGDFRFEAQVRARELKEPVTFQESTRVYDPNTGALDGEASKPPARSDLAIQPTGVQVAPADAAGAAAPAGAEVKETFELPAPPIPADAPDAGPGDGQEKRPEVPAESKDSTPARVASGAT